MHDISMIWWSTKDVFSNRCNVYPAYGLKVPQGSRKFMEATRTPLVLRLLCGSTHDIEGAPYMPKGSQDDMLNDPDLNACEDPGAGALLFLGLAGQGYSRTRARG